MGDQTLSKRPGELRAHYGAIIVGSGYGGAVMAARLAQAGVDVCVLERGVEWPAGRFPESQAGFAAATALVTPRRTFGRSDALFRFQLGAHYSALTGSGLGGTSLINAGVVLKPKQERLEALFPPEVLRELERGYARAHDALSPTPVPEHAAARLSALGRRAARVGAPFEPVPVAIGFEARRTVAGQQLSPCNACGNCITGCNVGAKGSLDRNYLPLAVQHGAELFTGVEVRQLVERPGGFGLCVALHTLERERFEDTELFLTADVVVLAAGSLGTTQLLGRSRDAGLPVSSKLGERFSGNGTVLAFTQRLDEPMRALGESSETASGRVGPSLTGMFDLRGGRQPLLLQDTAVPRPLVPFIRAVFGTRGRDLVGWSVTAGDDASGRLVVEHGRLDIDWRGAGRSEHHRGVDAALAAFSRALGGRHRTNPASWLPWKPLITTHPLGGCALGAVIDTDHRVFRGDSKRVHERLYVVDGSVFPGALGTNPLWTISALAERCAERLLEAHPALTRRRRPPTRTVRDEGVRFTERMEGWLSPVAPPRPQPRDRPRGASPLSFLLTVEWPSSAALSRDPAVVAASVGTLRCALLSLEPLTVTQGRFQLFVETPEGTRMRHELRLRARDGSEFLLEGHKEIVDDPGPDLFHDTRTLYLRVLRVDGDATSLVGHGVVQTALRDLAQQVQTIKGVDQPLSADLRTRAAFLQTFLGRVRREYGGLVLPLFR
ncbi:MAG: GMC family oxidoreductase N-terminal domain-containing protein [Myxococcota bacterium]